MVAHPKTIPGQKNRLMIYLPPKTPQGFQASRLLRSAPLTSKDLRPAVTWVWSDQKGLTAPAGIRLLLLGALFFLKQNLYSTTLEVAVVAIDGVAKPVNSGLASDTASDVWYSSTVKPKHLGQLIITRPASRTRELDCPGSRVILCFTPTPYT